MFVCPKCGNKDEEFIGVKNGKEYCRRCISFQGNMAERRIISSKDSDYEIKYSLSKEQAYISSSVVEAYKSHKNVMIHAVCGAGKTELVYGVISYALSNSLQVGFCIPRRDVVIDLLPRLKSAYPHKKVIAVYGGNTSCLEGDIILLTTHQLFRYSNYFDLLIIDEVDAFPYFGDFTLNQFFYKSLRGNYVMMTATPIKELIDAIKKDEGMYLTLQKRYHGHPLIVPRIKLALFYKTLYTIYILKRFLNNNKPVLVFAPTISSCEKLYFIISKFVRDGEEVHSKKENRGSIIMNFKKGKYKYLVTTSVLERGVTIKNLQVIVFDASHKLFDEKTLIQISGRVGRKIDAPDGEVIYVSDEISEAMESSRRKLIEANESL